MATIGSLIINLALNTAGLATGVASAEAQLTALDARISGVGVVSGTASVGMMRLAAAQDAVDAAARRLASAQETQTAATESQTVAQLKLTESTSNVNLMQSERVAIQARARQSTVAVAAADEQAAIAAGNLAKAQGFLAESRIAASTPIGNTSKKDFSMITAGATLASLAVLKFGYDSAKVAADFQYEMLLIQTQAGASTAQVEAMSAAVLAMAPTVQAGPMELAKGLFHIYSVGIQDAQALDVLKVAAEGAAVGNADLESVTNALIATVISGISDVQGMSHGITDMGQAMGILNGIVGSGNVRMEDLAKSLSSGVLSTARQFGLSIEQVGAALATMTDQGIPAEEAATRLRITIALLGAPTKLATAQLEKIGLTQRSLADEMRGPNGLVGAFQLLKEHMDGAGLDAVQQSLLLKTAFGGSRSSAGTLTLLNSIPLMNTKLSTIDTKRQSFAEDFAKEADTAKAHFANFGAAVEVLKVNIGNGLVPFLVVLTGALAELAKHTEILVPLFLLLTAVIVGAAVKSGVGLVISIGQIIAKMVEMSAVSFATRGAFEGLTVDTSLLATAQANLAATQDMVAPKIALTAEAAAAASLAAEELATATSVAATSTGPLVAGLSGVDGAIAATVESTGPLIAGFAGADGAISATAASTGPLVVGLAGVDGAVVAASTSTGELVVGLAGADGAIVATTESAGPLIVGLDAATASEDALGISTAAAITNLRGQAITMAETAGAADALALAEANVATAAAGAGVAAGAATVGVGGLAAAMGALALPVTIIVIALGLLMTHIDEVGQALRYLAFLFVTHIKTLFDVASQLPFVGDQFKGLAATFKDIQAGLVRDMQSAQDDMNKKAAEGGAAGIQAQMDAAKAAAQEAFNSLNETLIDLYGTSLGGAQAAAQEAGAKDMAAYAKGIQDARDAPVQALKDLLAAMQTTMTDSQEIMQLVGELNGNALAEGLASTDAHQYAVAETLRKSIVERLDQITGGAFTAGTQAGATWVESFRKEILAKGGSEADVESQLNALGPEKIAAAEAAYKKLGEEWKRMAPDATRAAQSYQDLLNSLDTTLGGIATTAAQAASDMTSAFSAIKADAVQYFDALHAANLQAIHDAHDLKNAQLDAKEALNQSPVTAAQKALDFQRKAIEEWRLRQAVAQAHDPAAQRDAILALNDFLAQKHIDQMQDEVDSANKSIEAQKKANDKKEAAAIAAETKRYENQKKEFGRELTALENFLKTHPAEWAKTQNKIIALLGAYGVSYKNAGSALGDDFVKGLQEQVQAAYDAAKALGAATKSGFAAGSGTIDPSYVPGWSGGNPGLSGAHMPTHDVSVGAVGSMIPGFANGSWQIMKDNMLAFLHKDEMVAPADVADLLRSIGSRRGGSTGGFMTVAPRPRSDVGGSDAGGDRGRGGGTVVVQVGSDKLAEITDKGIYVQGTIYRKPRVATGSRR